VILQEFSVSTNSAVFLIGFVFREVGFVTTVTEVIMSDVLEVVYCGMEMRVHDPRYLCQKISEIQSCFMLITLCIK